MSLDFLRRGDMSRHYDNRSPSFYSNYKHATSSGYGSSYTPKVHGQYSSTSSTRSIPSNNTNTVKQRFESSSFVSNKRPPSGSRPLPPGPGPLDSKNRHMPVDTALNVPAKLKLNKTRARESERTTGPVKAVKDYNRVTYSPTPTNGHASHENTYKENTYKASTLRREKHYASTSSLHSDSLDSFREEVQDFKTGSTRTSNHIINLQNDRVTNELPDIHTSSRTGSKELNGRSRESRELSRDLEYERSGSRRSASTTRVGRQGSFEKDSFTKSESKYSSDVANNNLGLLGLQNLGNTCYMNCMLQGLANTAPLRDYLMHGDWKSDVNSSSRMKGSLIKAFAKLVNSMWGRASSDYVSPREFRSELTHYARRFSGYGQQDAQEFLIFLLEGLHEDVNRVQKRATKTMLGDEHDNLPAAEKAMVSWKWYLGYDNSFMVDMFVGQLKSSLTCLKCGYVSNTFDPFWEIPLPLKKKGYGYRDMKLSECFEDFTREETLEDDERPTCAKCKKRQRCKKAFSIWKFPRILILHLKRFDPMAAYPTKLTTPVTFPLENLDLSEYAADHRDKSCMYDLYSVSNHMGTARGGHYTAYTRHPFSGEWHHFNDTRCSAMSKKTIVSSDAYVLFYERKDSKPTSRL